MYDKASIALIPSGYKAGSTDNLYSVLPANGNGDFNATRGSTATRVNKDGLIESVATNVPRLDYPLTNGVVGDCPHLLLEPSRTNLITDYTGAGFTAFNGASITANDSVSPDGSINATLMTTTGGANELIQQASITILSGQSYTISGYFKIKSGTLNDTDNGFKGLDGFSGGITGSTFNSTLTNEWQRLSFTITSTTTSGRVQIKCEDAAEILIWGLQVELGDYETSIIPTSGSAETRLADVCNSAGTSAEFNDSEGVLFAEIAALANDGTDRVIEVSNGSGNRLSIRFPSNDNQIRFFGRAGGSTQTNQFISVNDATAFNKIALKYEQDNVVGYINGVKVFTDTTFANLFVNLSELDFAQYNLSNPFYGKCKQLIVFNETLSDSELQTLTS